jgi:hypothetical protein
LNKNITVGGLVAGAVALGIAVAGPAHADAVNEKFLRDIQAAGFTADTGQGDLLAAGHYLCKDMDGGASSASVANDLYHAGALSQGGAQRFVAITIADLCPWNH